MRPKSLTTVSSQRDCGVALLSVHRSGRRRSTCFQQPIVHRRHGAADIVGVVRVIRSNGGTSGEKTHHENEGGQQQHRGLHAGAGAHSAVLLLRHGKLREGCDLEIAHAADGMAAAATERRSPVNFKQRNFRGDGQSSHHTGTGNTHLISGN